jgi:YfiH family protein
MITRRPNHVVRVTALEHMHLRHGFFTRNAAPDETHGSANCAVRNAEEIADVMHARSQCRELLEAVDLVTVKQRHTAEVVAVAEPWRWDEAPVADALVTDRRGIALGILTADCAPVLLADPDAGVVGAAHAGWRGAIGGVIENTVAAMAKMGAVRERIVAAVGPCIGAASYEVGPEFLAEFTGRDPNYGRFFDRRRERPHFDLAGFTAARLHAAGVAKVSVQGDDTLTGEALYFSFRRATLRGEPDYGRQLSAIALSGDPSATR